MIQQQTARGGFALGALLLCASASAQSPFGEPEALMYRSGLTTNAVVGDFDGDGVTDVIPQYP